MKRFFSRARLLLFVALACLVPLSAAFSCPLCLSPGQTLSEAVSEADIVVLAQFTETIRKTPDSEASGVVYQTVEVMKGEWKEKRIELSRFEFGQPGDLFLLTGKLKPSKSGDEKLSKADAVEWLSPKAVSELAFRYVQQAPNKEADGAQRMKYFVKFLESSDVTIANDAYGEFASAPYEDVVAIKDQFPREKLRQWIKAAQAKPDSPQKARSGLFCMMLGHCGDQSDEELLESMLAFTPKDGFILGQDGVMAGYLLLAGERGLKTLETKYLSNPQAPIFDLMQARTALSFIWTYEPTRFPKDRLRVATRLMLARSEMQTDIITDLARWQDWAAQPQLLQMLEESKDEHVRRAVVAYLIVSSESDAKSEQKQPHAVAAREQLTKLRESESPLVREAQSLLKRPMRQ